MSVQQLSDAVERLGVPIQRPVLSNLENGRRETISAAELNALAAALRVPSLLLEYPVGRVDAIEVLPGIKVSPWDGARWAIGDRELPDAEKWSDDVEVLREFQLHQNQVDHALEARQAALEAELLSEADTDPDRRDGLKEVVEAVQARARRADFALWWTRKHMSRAGLIPPDLPPELAHIDGPYFQPPQIADPTPAVPE